MIKCNLKQYMEMRNINFSQLSKLTGISRQALTALANNESSGIQFTTLDTLLIFFNAPINEFFTQSAMEFGVYLDFPNENVIDKVHLCIQYNKEEIVIPYNVDFLTNKNDSLVIVEFSSDSYRELWLKNKHISEPFFLLMSTDITDDRINEFGAFLIKDMLPTLKELYSFDMELRVNIDLEYSNRTAWVGLDSNKNIIIDERSEFNNDDDRIFLIDFDK
ncbi:helix-turn-helix domain-containing protein [Vagococcus fluvialis]|uniref:helix-turn-helix domain-containing protein n=1 Tax=Vagococcus fluvialis TaxID=2738 RepID=UPI0037898F1F